MSASPRLPPRFRRLPMEERRAAVAAMCGGDAELARATAGSPELMELADIMVESAVGLMPVPLGLATGFLIDGGEYAIPMATEEASVVAGACYAARIVSLGGGFRTWAREPVMAADVYLEGVLAGAEGRLTDIEPQIQTELRRYLASMEERGGGYRGMRVTRLAETGLVRVELQVDVRDAMGANVLNSSAEHVRGMLERASGGTTLMCILSNAARERLAGARFTVPFEHLGVACPPGIGAAELARRVAAASDLAQEDRERAVTHNKGIMNGISALALATGNDTRAIEAGAHAWASRSGRYRGLSSFSIESSAAGQLLSGTLELPLALGAVGGSVGFHPASAYCLRVLGQPTGTGLARIAAALGLAQNLAAVVALVGQGIQKGHMRLHASRMAYSAGARGTELPLVADRLASLVAERGHANAADARRFLAELREAGRAP